MIRALSFTPGDLSIELTTLPEDLPAGLGLSVWVYRSGSDPMQRLLRLGAPGLPELVLETGAEPDTLVLAQSSGSQRWEIKARGALPAGRWVPVRFTIGPDAAATLDVFGLRVAAGGIGPALARGARQLSIASSTPKNRFTGAFSSLQIYQHTRMDAADLWASYSLEDAPLLRTETLRNGSVRKIYRIEDQSGHNQHASTAAPHITTYEGSREGGAAPALRIRSTSGGLSLAPIARIAGGFTIEAWVRPATSGQSRTLLGIQTPAAVFRLNVGDTNGAVSLDLDVKAYPSLSRHLIVARGVVTQDNWSHLAVTVERSGRTYNVALYHQGQLRSRASFSLPIPINLLSEISTRLDLGGRSFGGHIAELRISSGALSEAELGSRWLRRLCGDETTLQACYPLDEQTVGYTRDASLNQGICVLGTDAAIEEVPGLPILSPRTADGIRVSTSGKLLRETLLIVPRDFTSARLRLPAGPIAGDTDPTRVTCSLYDATLEPRAESGLAFDAPLELRVDQEVTALLLDNQGVARPQRWVPGQNYQQVLPPGGILRLRFLADGLSAPTLRARMSGMPDGSWILVRPDAAAHDKLRTLSGADLLSPPDGRPSPLRSGTSRGDADALAGAVTGLARTLPPVPTASPRIVGEARGLFDVITDAYEEGKELVNDAADAVGNLADAVADVGQDAIREATRLPKTAGQLLKWTGSALDELVKKARQVPARMGIEAIGTYLASADSLAVISTGAFNELAHQLEVVGTSIVKGTTVYWRVVVSGVKEGLAAIEALCLRVGAAIEKFIEYLAYLFNWGDILKAADQCYALLEQTIGQIPEQIRSLDRYKPRLSKALNSVVDASMLDRSLGQIMGIDINPNTPGVAELDYVMEQFQRVMSIVDMVSTGGPGGVAGAAEAAVQGAGATNSTELLKKLPYDRFTNPVAVLSTPLSQLVGNAASLSGSGGNLVDQAFQSMQDGASAAIDRGMEIIRKRLYVPGLTPLIEQTVLGGRSLTALRIVSLVAGICTVLTDKLTRSARGQGRAGASRSSVKLRTAVSRSNDGTTSPTEVRTNEPAQPSGFEIWLPTALDLINTAIIGWQTYLELSTLGKKNAAIETSLNLWGLVSGAIVAIKGVMWIALYSRYYRGSLRDYYIAAASFEVASGAYLCLTNGQRLAAKDTITRQPTANLTSDETRDKVDAVFLGILMVATTVTSVLPIALGLVNGRDAQVQYGLRTAVWVMNMSTRGLSFFDNGNTSIKRVTVAAVALNCATDLTEAIYNHATSTPSK